MRKDYSDKFEDVVMMKTPVISALGRDIGLASDAVLSAIVQGIDEGKSNAEIKSLGLTGSPTDTQIDRIREARGIYHNLGYNYQAYIPSYSGAREVAKLFLRFMFNDKAMKIYRDETFTELPLSYVGALPALDANQGFMQSAMDILHSADSFPISILTRISPFNGVLGYATNYSPSELCTGFFNGTMTAQYPFDYMKDRMKEQWRKFVRDAGVVD